ncbi:1-acyl-sn-glycerol-3-phosphate acyltransferase [Candidatus Berkelbacteria bacterium]|nr:1-acyl-sn-glycerol-3-phosphate acyltransferase [Candidatus Berkelbacteria bacterium]
MLGWVQLLIWCVFHPVTTALLRLRVRWNPRSVWLAERSEPLILAANHTSYYDWLLLFALPWRVARRIVPVAILMGERHYRMLPIWLITAPFGVIPVKSHAWTLESYLGEAIRRSRKGASVLIFPQGTVDPTGSAPARIGVAYLAATSQRSVLPVTVAGIQSATLSDVVLRRRQLTLFLGSTTFAPPPVNAPQAAIRRFTDRIGRALGIRQPGS